MRDLKYVDEAGHPARQEHQKLAQKLLDTFQDVTQQRPCARPSSGCTPGAAAEAVVQSGSRADVLDTEDAYDGWEQDLRSQHSVILKPSNGNNKLSFECELCGVWLPIWCQSPRHCRGAQHQKKNAALEPDNKFVPASSVEPICEEEWALMRFYAENGKLEYIDAKLRAGSDPNATGPGDYRTPLFWAAWEGHEHVIRRLLE